VSVALGHNTRAASAAASPITNRAAAWPVAAEAAVNCPEATMLRHAPLSINSTLMSMPTRLRRQITPNRPKASSSRLTS